jgi:hypothetical protein
MPSPATPRVGRQPLRQSTAGAASGPQVTLGRDWRARLARTSARTRLTKEARGGTPTQPGENP